MNLPNIIYFSPQHWGQLERFERLHHGTYQFPDHIRDCVSGTSANFHRALILKGLAESMIGMMKEDHAELENYGFSSNRTSSNISAVTESVITSLYSSRGGPQKLDHRLR
jgi:hypothetical protein